MSVDCGVRSSVAGAPCSSCNSLLDNGSVSTAVVAVLSGLQRVPTEPLSDDGTCAWARLGRGEVDGMAKYWTKSCNAGAGCGPVGDKCPECWAAKLVARMAQNPVMADSKLEHRHLVVDGKWTGQVRWDLDKMRLPLYRDGQVVASELDELDDRQLVEFHDSSVGVTPQRPPPGRREGVADPVLRTARRDVAHLSPSSRVTRITGWLRRYPT